MRVLPAGDAAVLVEVDEAGPLYAALRAAELPGVLDLVPATRTVLITLDRAVTDPGAVTAAVQALPVTDAAAAGPGDLVEIPTRYDGPDLAEVAALTGLSAGEVGQLIEKVCGEPPPAALALAVRDRTAGNPFFTRQIARLLAAQGV
ncbi:MAG TPA: carboxyltransferase domain-containing protein, partial [Mycobacteriales bacterium]|nr:carboxyltransferase domain-containing protein [Mycobacteriales bacterium]